MHTAPLPSWSLANKSVTSFKPIVRRLYAGYPTMAEPAKQGYGEKQEEGLLRLDD